MNANDRHTCVICSKEFIGYGNNPWPLVDDEDARCCNFCNDTRVIPVRLGLTLKGGE